MNESAIKHLDTVLFLVKEQRKAISRIKKTTHKCRGLCTVQYSADEKAELIQQAQRQYKRLIYDAYKRLNAELETDERFTLINPFI